MDTKKPQELLQKYREGTLSPEEKNILDGWALQLSHEENIDLSGIDLETNQAASFERLLAEINSQKTTRSLWPRIAAAASILLCLSAGAYFALHKKPVDLTAQIQVHDIAPGSNKATLTLASGQKIVLDNAASGKLAKQGNTVIQKNSGGTVTYTAANIEAPSDQPIQYNTLTTKKGEQYALVLADGTKVWLNSASSITYPAAFSGGERRVEISGEALFDVAHNSARPFRVSVNGQIVKDIGTRFDVNAYSDEPGTATTLLEGAVEVSAGGNNALLKPGQQAVLQSSGAAFVVKNVNTEQAVAWQKGLFIFDHTSLYALMRQLSRWYDVEVVYEGAVKDVPCFGRINRSVNLSQVLKYLEIGGLHFRVEGKKLIVLP
jgi:transmembrane sensor